MLLLLFCSQPNEWDIEILFNWKLALCVPLSTCQCMHILIKLKYFYLPCSNCAWSHVCVEHAEKQYDRKPSKHRPHITCSPNTCATKTWMIKFDKQNDIEQTMCIIICVWYWKSVQPRTHTDIIFSHVASICAMHDLHGGFNFNNFTMPLGIHSLQFSNHYE